MAFVTPKMSLTVWNSNSDPYDHQQLADNFLKLDLHDHSDGRGTKITGAGIVHSSITLDHLAPGVILDTFNVGLIANLPAIGLPGQFYYATDVGSGSLLIEADGAWRTVRQGHTSGTLAARPVAPSNGFLYLATDIGPSGVLYIGLGGSWYEVAGAEVARVVGAGGQPTFQNSWSATGSAPRFWKEGGRVYLAGSVQHSDTGLNTTIFTLPVGYRPSLAARFTVGIEVAFATSDIATILFGTDGTIAPTEASYSGSAGNRSFSFDGLSFDVSR